MRTVTTRSALVVFRALICSALIGSALIGSRCVLADETGERQRGLRVGQRATVSGVYFATGAWADEYKMICPAAVRGNAPKIAVYAMNLDENVLDLALAIDERISRDPSLKWSFVSVSDSKGGHAGVRSPSYYTEHELANRLRDIKRMAAEKGIKQLTLGVTSSSAAKEREKLGMSDEHDVLIAFLEGNRRTSRLVRFVEGLDSSMVDAERIESLLAQIQAIRAK